MCSITRAKPRPEISSNMVFRLRESVQNNIAGPLISVFSTDLFFLFQAEICIPDFSTECEEETISGKRLAEDELCFDITKTVCSMETARQNNAE